MFFIPQNKLSLALAACCALSSCDMGSKTTKIQYMPDMADAPTVKAQEGYLDPPVHSIKKDAIIYPATVEEAEKVLQNPYAFDQEGILAQGKALYEKVCVTCHGADGKGEHLLKGFPKPPDISTADYYKKKDGFYFYRITFGAANMPGYAHSTSASERWKITHYLRTLQQK